MAKQVVFDSEVASGMVKDMRATFDSGNTRSYGWRCSQLKALIKLSEDHEQDIVRALHSDLSKSETEAFLQEVTLTLTLQIRILIFIQAFVRTHNLETE
ncbi:hypothetical protein RJT34_12265 [Clitoria ternatea]|uniref:Uncharacterized protein n=1 Tax=Clitoria ternatea TaxID=43366 RepID=A0AAN9JP69_CLITE